MAGVVGVYRVCVARGSKRENTCLRATYFRLGSLGCAHPMLTSLRLQSKKFDYINVRG